MMLGGRTWTRYPYVPHNTPRTHGRQDVSSSPSPPWTDCSVSTAPRYPMYRSPAASVEEKEGRAAAAMATIASSSGPARSLELSSKTSSHSLPGKDEEGRKSARCVARVCLDQ